MQLDRRLYGPELDWIGRMQHDAVDPNPMLQPIYPTVETFSSFFHLLNWDADAYTLFRTFTASLF